MSQATTSARVEFDPMTVDGEASCASITLADTVTFSTFAVTGDVFVLGTRVDLTAQHISTAEMTAIHVNEVECEATV